MSASVPEMEVVYASGRRGGASFFEDVPLVEFMYTVSTCMPGGVTEGDSGQLLCPLSVKRH